jgi:F-type H+-transporting ATPase subunit b
VYLRELCGQRFRKRYRKLSPCQGVSIIDTFVATVLILLVLEVGLLPYRTSKGSVSQFVHQPMDQTLRQLGELLLGAVPTVILLATLSILYTFLVHRPLTAVLAERRNRTQGAIEKARADIAAAEARTADYEQRLREARQKIFKNQEARRQQATQSRNQIVHQAHTRAQEQIKQARAGIGEDKQQAMSKLQSDAARLATEIVRIVMRPMASPSQVGGQ